MCKNGEVYVVDFACAKSCRVYLYAGSRCLLHNLTDMRRKPLACISLCVDRVPVVYQRQQGIMGVYSTTRCQNLRVWEINKPLRHRAIAMRLSTLLLITHTLAVPPLDPPLSHRLLVDTSRWTSTCRMSSSTRLWHHVALFGPTSPYFEDTHSRGEEASW
jgi:hypothetical protein